MSTLPLCCFVHLILSSLIYGQRRKGREKKEEEKEVCTGCHLKSNGFIESWALLNQEAKWAAAAVVSPLECAVEVGRSRGSSFSLQKLFPKQSSDFRFGNLDFPWWCPWLQSPGLHTPSLQFFFSPWNCRTGAMDLPLKRPIKICFVGGGKDHHYWFSQEVPEAVRAGQYNFDLSWKNLALLNTASSKH